MKRTYKGPFHFYKNSNYMRIYILWIVKRSKSQSTFILQFIYYQFDF